MFVMHSKDLIPDGKNPTYLTGYGGFNISETPSFSTFYLTFLKLGGVIAIPNLRGGGEYGKDWHERRMKREKTKRF